MKFGSALNAVLGGNSVARNAWGAGVYITVDAMDPTHIDITNAGVTTDWTATSADLLADDWEIVNV